MNPSSVPSEGFLEIVHRDDRFPRNGAVGPRTLLVCALTGVVQGVAEVTTSGLVLTQMNEEAERMLLREVAPLAMCGCSLTTAVAVAAERMHYEVVPWLVVE